MIDQVKCLIMPFNPCWVPHDLDEIDLSATDTTGDVNNAAGYPAGDVTLIVDNLTTAPPIGSVVRFAGHDWAYKLTTGTTSTSLVLMNSLQKSVADNEVFYIEPVIDVSTDVLAISDWEFEPEVSQNQFTLDNQMDFVFSNADNQFYDRLRYLSSWVHGQPYLISNFDIEHDRTPKFIRVSVKDGATWSTFYAGRFVEGETFVSYPDNTVVVLVESVLYMLRDQLMMDVEGVYNNLKYTDDNNPTRTICGPLKTIIQKTFYEAGITKVLFDFPAYFANETHYNWQYTFDDIWFNTPIWKQNDVDSSEVLMWLEEIMKRFLASIVLHFEDNTAYIYFRSKRNTEPHFDTLTPESFVGQTDKDKVTIESWTHYSENGVFAKSTYTYWNGASLESGFHVDGTGFHHVTGWPVEKQIGVEGARSLFLEAAEGDKIEVVNGSVYTVKDKEGSVLWIVRDRYKVAPDIQENIREHTPFAKNAGSDVTLEFGECLKFKMRFPDIFVACAENSFIQLSNFANLGGSPIGYRKVGPFDGTNPAASRYNGIAVVDLVPVSWHHQTATRCAFFTDRADTDNEALAFSTLDIPSADEFTGTGVWLTQSIHTFPEGGSAQGATHISAGFLKTRNEETEEVKTLLVLCVGFVMFLEERIKRFVIDMDIQAGPIHDYFWFGILNFTDDDLVDYTGVSVSASEGTNPKTITTGGALSGDIRGVFVNSDNLNPWADDKLYYTWNEDDRLFKRQLFAENLSTGEDNVFPTGTSLGARFYGLHVHADESVTNGQHVYVVDDLNDRVYKGYGTSLDNFSVIAGGGLTPFPALYNHETATDTKLEDPSSVWKAYDNLAVICDRGEEKVAVVDLDNNLLYTVTDATITELPSQVCAEDFMSSWIIEASPAQGSIWPFYVNFDYIASRWMYEYYGKRRRLFSGRVLASELSRRPKMYDTLRISSDVVISSAGGDVDCWIVSMRYNFERKEYYLELLERDV